MNPINVKKNNAAGEYPSPVCCFKRLRILAAILVSILSMQFSAAAQSLANNEGPPENVKNVFAAVSAGLATGNVSGFSKFITNQTYLSLSSSVSGYFSPNQAYYILQDFLKNGNPVSFKFTMMETEGNPYATGVIYFESRNRKSTAQVYISLTKSGSNWYISQLTIK